MSANKSPYFIVKAATMDGETQLISDAPGDLRVITQNALTGAGIASSEYMQIQTKLQDVMAVEGFKHHEYTCRKIIRYGETQNAIVRGCWIKVSADIFKLKKAYAYTLAIKYGQGKANKFEQLMDKEIEKINNHKRYKDEDTNIDNSSTDNSQSLQQMPNNSQDKQQVYSNSSNGRDLSRSENESSNEYAKTGIASISKLKNNTIKNN